MKFLNQVLIEMNSSRSHKGAYLIYCQLHVCIKTPLYITLRKKTQKLPKLFVFGTTELVKGLIIVKLHGNCLENTNLDESNKCWK